MCVQNCFVLFLTKFGSPVTSWQRRGDMWQRENDMGGGAGAYKAFWLDEGVNPRVRGIVSLCYEHVTMKCYYARLYFKKCLSNCVFIIYSLPPCHHLWGLILLLLLFNLLNYYFLVVLIVLGKCHGALIVMLSMLLYQMLVHRHSNFVNLSKYDALLSLEASKVYCRHCLTRIFSVTFRAVIPPQSVQDWFIKNCLTCCQHAFYKEILVVMLLFKYFANLFCIFLNLKNNNCTRQGCCFFHPILYLFVFCLFTAQTNGAEVLCRKTGPACRRHRQDQWVSKNARELHRRVYHIDSTPFISLDNFSLFMNMVKNLDSLSPFAELVNEFCGGQRFL